MDKQTGDQNKRLSERLASARIEGARKSRATELYLSGQSLTHLSVTKIHGAFPT